MKRAILVSLLLLPLLPIGSVNAEEIPFQLYNPDTAHIHPGSNSTLTLKWWNLVDEDRTMVIEEGSTPNGFELGGVPFTQGTGAGLYSETWLKVHVNETLAFGTYEFNLSISCPEVNGWSEEMRVAIEVARPSSLRFGAESSSTFSVNPGVRFGIKVNLSNEAQWDDNATLSLQSSSNWNTGWNMDDVQGENALLELDSSQVDWVNLWVEVPEVIDSVPRSGTGPSFTLSAQSELDRRFVRWEFTIEVGVFKNVTLIAVEDSIDIDPGGRSWLNVTFNNNGNHDTTYDIDIRQVNPDGSQINGAQKSNLLEADGWKVGLFKDFEENILRRADDRKFEVSFEAPVEEDSEIWIEVIISPKGAEERSISTIVSAHIEVQQSVEITLDDDCERINTTTGCVLGIAVLNTGNFHAPITIEVVPGSNFEQVNRSFNLSIDSGETSSTIAMQLSTEEDLLAFTRGSISVRASNSTGVVLAQENLSYVIDPIISWDWERADSELDYSNNLSILITIRNDGNAIDGITVRMHTNVYTEQGFIPPDGAVVEEGVKNPRSFEVHNVPLRANYSFRAWVNLPDDQHAAGVLFVNLTIQSQYSSENPFRYTVSENYSAQEKSTKEESVIDDLSSVIADAQTLMGAWWHIVLAIIISGLILNKAINERIKRKEDEPRKIISEEPETVEDWQEKFQTGHKKEDLDLSSPEIDSANFTREFQSKAAPKPVTSGVSRELIGAATTVLDHHDEQSMMHRMDSLVDEILNEPSQPHEANVALPAAEAITERTIPQKKQDDLDI